MKKYTIHPENVCSYEMNLEVDDNNVIKSLTVSGGCQGNLRGIAKLCEGRRLEEVASLLEGITCRGSRNKNTSCPDQLAQGIKKILSEIK